jgi:hypothetical protein
MLVNFEDSILAHFLFFSFLRHTINTIAFLRRAKAHIIRYAAGFAQIAGFPAVDQISFPDKRTAHGDIVGNPFFHKMFSHLKGSVATHQNNGDIDLLFKIPGGIGVWPVNLG